MRKLAVFLFAAVILLSSIVITSASASSVSISFSGERNVKPDKTYTLNYVVSMTDSQAIRMCFKCSDAIISGDTEVDYEKRDPIQNTNYDKDGSVKVKISESNKPGDTIIITATGKYSIANEMGIPDSWHNISESYTLTVVADEEPTPSPTTAPTPSPAPNTASELTSAPSPEPIITSTPIISPRPSTKPLNSASPADPIESPSQAPMGLETAVMPSSTPLLDSIDALCAELDTMEQGGIITISLDSTSLSTLSAQTLAALKAKQGTLVINFSGYSCSIDGVEMGTLPIEPVNIEMKMTKKEAVTVTADGQDVYQLHFTQIGDLPGCFTYSFEALKSRPDDALYLYCYHDTSGLAEYKRSTFVDKNNCAAFEIYEGGSYFVTTSPITENPVTGQFSKPEDTTPLGDIWSIVVPVVCIICAGAAFIVVLCRKGFFKIGR